MPFSVFTKNEINGIIGAGEKCYIKQQKTKRKDKKLYNLITEDPIEINELAKKSNLDISELNQKITMMEIEGYIESLPGNEYKRVE